MCILEVPVHTWCNCAPAVHLQDDGAGCSHHVYVSREHPLPCPSVSPIPSNPPREDLLDPRTFPGPKWINCPTYLAQWTGLDGTLSPGWEMRCPETLARIQANGTTGYQQTYVWDGLCSRCERGQGRPLPLVPVRRACAWKDAEVLENRLLDLLTGATWEDVTDLPQLVKADGTRVDEDVAHALVNLRAERSRNERVYVYHERRPSSWDADLDVSAIYLLPGSSPVLPVKPPAESREVLTSPRRTVRPGLCVTDWIVRYAAQSVFLGLKGAHTMADPLPPLPPSPASLWTVDPTV